MSQPKQHAVVLGGSMAGLLTARVLSDHFEKVTLVERDKLTDRAEARRGQPQARHLHVLLPKGLLILSRYFPDLVPALAGAGAVFQDPSLTMRYFSAGGYRVQFASGKQMVTMSRPLLEKFVRDRVLALEAVSFIDQCHVSELLRSPDAKGVTGVKLEHRDSSTNDAEVLLADLIVDTRGRGSSAPKDLETLGFQKPAANAVSVDVGYATRLFERDADEPPGSYVSLPNMPQEQRGGLAFQIEGDRWIVTLAGFKEDKPPADEAGFRAFAKVLPSPDIYQLIERSQAVSDITLHRFPASLRYHYERLSDFPRGYSVLGDAICSFNPIYGQGMTSAALQVEALDEVLKTTELANIAKPFFIRAAKVVSTPWRTAVGSDFRMPHTRGKKPPLTDPINAYMTQVQRATHHDPVVCQTFAEVTGMIRPPVSLFVPRIVWRVLKNRLRSKRPEPVAGARTA